MQNVLDPCCGSKMFYFDKNDPRVMFCDCRELETSLCDGRTLMVKPDMIVDFRDLPFTDGQFPLVVFDPPHLVRAGENSWMRKKYGKLPKEGWKEYLAQGFNECWRVLSAKGTLVFKWNEDQITIGNIEDIFPTKPIMGTRTNTKTMFIVFFKE